MAAIVRPYVVEYYKSTKHIRPVTRGYPMDVWGAARGAAIHLALHDCTLAVCTDRRTGRVLWSRTRPAGW